MLTGVRAALVAEGYDVQTIRIATPPVLDAVAPATRNAALAAVQALDRMVASRDALLSVGPASARKDSPDDALARWLSDLIASTTATFASVSVGSEVAGVDRRASMLAADVIATLGRSTPGGSGNFRFAAAACIAPGTPFFPVAFHDGPASLALGLESAGLVHDAFSGADDGEHAVQRLRERLAHALTMLDRRMRVLARRAGMKWYGIDTSPAPLQAVSIGSAIEALTGMPFGAPGTLDACARVTSVLRSLPVRLCGYCGLMLPVLEDQVLAKRVGEHRFDLRDLLLYSSVCGTGLDMVPLPGEVPRATLAGIIADVGTLAVRLRKPLSARLYLVPGRTAGEIAEFDNPYLTPAMVMNPDR